MRCPLRVERHQPLPRLPSFLRMESSGSTSDPPPAVLETSSSAERGRSGSRNPAITEDQAASSGLPPRRMALSLWVVGPKSPGVISTSKPIRRCTGSLDTPLRTTTLTRASTSCQQGDLGTRDERMLVRVSGGDWLGGGEGHGGVPTSGQGYFAAQGRAGDIADELKRTRGPRRPRDPKRRWWQFWRRRDGSV